MANALNKTLTTALMSGVMVFALAAPSWAKIDYTTKNGGAAVASVEPENPAATAAYLQSFMQQQALSQMMQGNMNNMLATTLSQQLMNGQFDPVSMLKGVAVGMIQQKLGDFMQQAGLANFGGLAQGFAGGLMGGNTGLSGLSGLGGTGLSGLGGSGLGGLGNFGGLTGGLGGLSGGGLDGFLQNAASAALNQAIAGGIQTAISSITSGGSSGGSSDSTSYNSAYDPVDTTSNNFGGATTIVLSADPNTVINEDSDNFEAGMSAAYDLSGLSSTYLVTQADGTTKYDVNYKAGYDKMMKALHPELVASAN